jgi:hypothetical protein
VWQAAGNFRDGGRVGRHSASGLAWASHSKGKAGDRTLGGSVDVPKWTPPALTCEQADRQTGTNADMQPANPAKALPFVRPCGQAGRPLAGHFGRVSNWSPCTLLSMLTGKHANRQRGQNADWRAYPFGQVRHLAEWPPPIRGNSSTKMNISAGRVQPQA